MAEYTKQDIKKLCKGRTEEQKKVIKYFLGSGCLFGGMSDDEYWFRQRQKAGTSSRELLTKLVESLNKFQLSTLYTLKDICLMTETLMLSGARIVNGEAQNIRFLGFSSLRHRFMYISIHLIWMKMVRKKGPRNISIKISQISQIHLIQLKSLILKR